MFLLTGGLGDAGAQPNPSDGWLENRAWKELCKLSRLPAYEGLSAAIAADVDSWRPLYDSQEPHKLSFPGAFNKLLTFRKILIIRCMRWVHFLTYAFAIVRIFRSDPLNWLLCPPAYVFSM